MSTLQQMCAAALAREASLQAVEYEECWHSWGELRQVADQVRALLAESGAAPDAPVVFAPRNRPSSLATLLALMAQGRTVRMVYAFQSPAGIARDIARLGAPVAILAEEDVSDEVRAALRSCGIAGMKLSALGAHAIPGHERASFNAEAPGEPRIEILTSGTTGPPKQFPILYSMILKLLASSGSLTPAGAADWSKEPPYIIYFPLGNISGIYSSVPTMLKGQRAVLLDRFSLEKWHQFVVRHRPAASGIPPAAMQALLDSNIPVDDLSSLKSMGLGAAPLDPTLQRAFEQRYNIPILLSYGATEFAGPVTAMTAELHAQWGEQKFGSVGRALSGAQLRVVDAETSEVLPTGQEGLLEVVSPRIGPDWIRTADIAMIDADGFLFHCGRADGAIMRGGFKLLPETIERALLLHPAVSAAAVIGVPDKRLSEVPGAAIVIKPDTDAPSIAALESHLREHVLATHIPVHWRIVESLPKTPSFKIDRPAVKRLFEAGA